MKTLIKKLTFGLTLLLIVNSAMAQIEFDEKRTSHDEMINLYKLNCLVNLGSSISQARREVTVLEGFFIRADIFPTLHFEHKKAFASNCDRAALDKLVDDSFTSFNHAMAKITLIQKTAKVPRLYRGQCVRNIQEFVEIDFKQGTLLKTSELGKVIPATGCQ